MARATFVKKAQHDIYVQGKRTTYKGQEGSKRAGLTLNKTDRSQPADKQDKILVHKGESYYWWQFKGMEKSISPTAPRRSQLTRSEFLGWLYALEDTIRDYSLEATADTDSDDLSSQRDEWVEEVNSQVEELQSKLDSMPEQLQDSSVLPERIEGLESWASELENVDCELDLDELLSKAAEEAEEEKVPDGEHKEWVQERYLELLQERIDEVISELQSQTSGL